MLFIYYPPTFIMDYQETPANSTRKYHPGPVQRHYGRNYIHSKITLLFTSTYLMVSWINMPHTLRRLQSTINHMRLESREPVGMWLVSELLGIQEESCWLLEKSQTKRLSLNSVMQHYMRSRK